ncbi:MAG: hypothetical protein H6585_07245 [Flavobacteriales bacterium]|nr:hypothetical protein [Flavobacteriales bacterium]MCB9448121.1 hypothetical protein [Flavobacteriales bacterium]
MKKKNLLASLAICLGLGAMLSSCSTSDNFSRTRYRQDHKMVRVGKKQKDNESFARYTEDLQTPKQVQAMDEPSSTPNHIELRSEEMPKLAQNQLAGEHTVLSEKKTKKIEKKIGKVLNKVERFHNSDLIHDARSTENIAQADHASRSDNGSLLYIILVVLLVLLILSLLGTIPILGELLWLIIVIFLIVLLLRVLGVI